MTRCPHGDLYCPCQDGDTCHYEGLDPMPCPNHPREHVAGRMSLSVVADEVRKLPHCHVEGCRWAGEKPTSQACGLQILAPNAPIMDGFEIGCGLVRRIVEVPRHDGTLRQAFGLDPR